MKNYEAISETVNDLVQRGYTIDFTTQVNKDCPVYYRTSIGLPSNDFQIDEIYRFGDDTTLDNEIIVSAISSPVNNIKGIKANVYGRYAQTIRASVNENLSLQRDQETFLIEGI